MGVLRQRQVTMLRLLSLEAVCPSYVWSVRRTLLSPSKVGHPQRGSLWYGWLRQPTQLCVRVYVGLVAGLPATHAYILALWRSPATTITRCDYY